MNDEDERGLTHFHCWVRFGFQTKLDESIENGMTLIDMDGVLHCNKATMPEIEDFTRRVIAEEEYMKYIYSLKYSKLTR